MNANVSAYKSAQRARQRLSNMIANLANRNLPLQDFLDNAPRELSPQLAGIYTGQAGQAIAPYDNDHNIVVQWHNGRVEVAYIS